MPETLRILLRFALLLLAVLAGALVLTEPFRLVLGGAIAGASIALGGAYLVAHAVRLALVTSPELSPVVWSLLDWEGERATNQTRAALAALLLVKDDQPATPPPTSSERGAKLDALNALGEKLGDLVIELECATQTHSELWTTIAEIHEQVERWRARLEIAEASKTGRALQ
jgi:hypothetical protein